MITKIYLRQLISFLSISLLVIFRSDENQAQVFPSWAWPAYSATQPQEKAISMIDHYRYREVKYEPPIVVQAISRERQSYRTPEEAMISRMSAMMTSDFDWWMSTWDQDARKQTIDNQKAEGRTKEFWVQWWQEMFSTIRVVLVRRIETGKYVVLTYRLMTPEGQDAGNEMEFPTIFHDVEGKWLATLDLSEDSLVFQSPWVSGKNETEETVR
jgi:hypothetical protein